MHLTWHANTCLEAISRIGHKMSKIKGIAFDKDGTLIDFDASWAAGFRALINSIFPNNIKHQNILANAAGFNTATNKFLGGSIFVNGTTQDLLDVWLSFFPELNSEMVLEKSEVAFNQLDPVPLCNLYNFLSKLRTHGYFLGVITNAAEAPTLIQLEKLGCLDLFDKVIGCDSGYDPKPSGSSILGFCDAVGITPSEVAMVGDSTHDLNAGQNAGVGLNVGVLSGPASYEQISDIADIVLDNILSLHKVLK